MRENWAPKMHLGRFRLRPSTFRANSKNVNAAGLSLPGESKFPPKVGSFQEILSHSENWSMMNTK